MTFDLSDILASKRAHRSRLAALPIGEKLRLLDALRERTIALHVAAAQAGLRGRPPGDADPPEPAWNPGAPR